jgi:D-tyrosyl-tRNA(Tyr) deacylase
VRAVVQRVRSASVEVEGEVVGRIGVGLLVFVGVAEGDDPADIEYTASKILSLRVFPDDEGRMNQSVVDTNGGLLVVSQFTLLGDVRRGRRPAFDAAASSEDARQVYEALLDRLRERMPVESGVFQASMQVESTNDGPVTILVDSRRLF